MGFQDFDVKDTPAQRRYEHRQDMTIWKMPRSKKVAPAPREVVRRAMVLFIFTLLLVLGVVIIFNSDIQFSTDDADRAASYMKQHLRSLEQQQTLRQGDD